MNMRSEIYYITKLITNLTKEGQNEIYEFLEHDEWGIALETLCAILCEENITITEKVYDLIKEAGETMEMDSLTWECVKNLIR